MVVKENGLKPLASLPVITQSPFNPSSEFTSGFYNSQTLTDNDDPQLFQSGNQQIFEVNSKNYINERTEPGKEILRQELPQKQSKLYSPNKFNIKDFSSNYRSHIDNFIEKSISNNSNISFDSIHRSKAEIESFNTEPIKLQKDSFQAICKDQKILDKRNDVSAYSNRSGGLLTFDSTKFVEDCLKEVTNKYLGGLTESTGNLLIKNEAKYDFKDTGPNKENAYKSANDDKRNLSQKLNFENIIPRPGVNNNVAQNNKIGRTLIYE